METDMDTKCKLCEKICKSYTALVAHKKWKHTNPVIHKCTECNKVFDKAVRLRKHLLSNHKNKAPTKCGLCGEAGDKGFINNHLVTKHNIYLDTEIFVFSNQSEFWTWKESIEKETSSKYVFYYKKQNKDKSVTAKYMCHRAGKFKSESQGVRKLKKHGSNKIDAHCPAEITIKEFEDKISVKFIKTHVGHEVEVGRLRLTKSEKKDIATKVAKNIPVVDILNEIHQNTDKEQINRIDITTKKDIHNIIHSFNLHEYAIKEVESWVQKIREESNVVRYYKPKGCLDDAYPFLNQEDFCLIIAKNSQLEVFQKYQNTVICIDRIRGSKLHDFELFTIMVIDNEQQAYPCSFMVSNREDSAIIELYFRTIMSCIHGLVVTSKWFMSDIGESFYNGWSFVSPANVKHLYCTWHVDKAWQNNLKMITVAKNRVETYKKLRLVLYEKNKYMFSTMLNNMQNDLHSHDETKEFAKYMDIFFNCPEKWSYCFRNCDEIRINMAFENLHRMLKNIYTRGINGKRFDIGIHRVMEYLRDNLFKRLTTTNVVKLSRKLKNLKARHKLSLEMDETHVQALSASKWQVVSPIDNGFCEIIEKQDPCLCKLRCKDCNCCMHKYSCTCNDSCFNWNMCKHIHLVCRVNGDKLELEVEEYENEIHDEVILYIDEIIGSFKSQKNVFDIERAKIGEVENMAEIINLIKTNGQLEAFRKHVAPLRSIILSADKET